MFYISASCATYLIAGQVVVFKVGLLDLVKDVPQERKVVFPTVRFLVNLKGHMIKQCF